jgi:hypothetical protein
MTIGVKVMGKGVASTCVGITGIDVSVPATTVPSISGVGAGVPTTPQLIKKINRMGMKRETRKDGLFIGTSFFFIVSDYKFDSYGTNILDNSSWFNVH